MTNDLLLASPRWILLSLCPMKLLCSIWYTDSPIPEHSFQISSLITHHPGFPHISLVSLDRSASLTFSYIFRNSFWAIVACICYMREVLIFFGMISLSFYNFLYYDSSSQGKSLNIYFLSSLCYCSEACDLGSAYQIDSQGTTTWNSVKMKKQLSGALTACWGL